MRVGRLPKPAVVVLIAVAASLALGAGPSSAQGRGEPPCDKPPASMEINRPIPAANPPRPPTSTPTPTPNRPLSPSRLAASSAPSMTKDTATAVIPASSPAPAPASAPAAKPPLALDPKQLMASLQTVGVFALVSLAPAAVLMVTAFVRINIVLILLRQALGSPQVPGNQVLTALALLLTALVMRPVAEVVYLRGIVPYASERATLSEAWEAGTAPIKAFMARQIQRTNHQHFLWQLYDYVAPPGPGQVDPKYVEDFPLRVVAPAFLLSELTTALAIGFSIYLPFLVIDLVVSAVLAAMGLFMLPPSLVALPLKLILFVLADGWLLVATMLLQSFEGG
ncbi:MAG: EscR/YscR/HrcR family type III secretion system export apparatus protein [Planctomycetaceae bacterium]|nr:EscR/YscR/HrcR family type III secretion system export apparatus protein [Planctomycetaceae bacterium]